MSKSAVPKWSPDPRSSFKSQIRRSFFLVNCSPYLFLQAQRITFYPQSLGAIKLRNHRGRSEERDKPVLSLVEGTCWTKPRSPTLLPAMGIVKRRSSGRESIGMSCGSNKVVAGIRRRSSGGSAEARKPGAKAGKSTPRRCRAFLIENQCGNPRRAHISVANPP